MSEQFFYKNNRFQQLKGFCSVVQTGSISKAANKMGLSQGAISLQIQSLERDLGIELFQRQKNKMIITKAGEIFYNSSVSYIQGVEELFSGFAQNMTQEQSRVINIAANHVSICYILPKFLRQFELSYPEVKFQIRSLIRQDAFERLKHGKVDILLYSMDQNSIPSEFEFIPIVQYKTVLLTKFDHPLAKSEKVNLSDIKKFKLLRLDDNFVTAPCFDEVLKIHGLETKIEFEMANYEILKKFIKADLGVSIISDICLEGESDNELVSRDLSDYFPKINYGILFRKEQRFSGLLKKFVEILKTERLLTAQNQDMVKNHVL